MQGKDAITAKKIIKYCDDIERYICGMREEDFSEDDKTISACAFCLGQIGELTKHISNETQQQYSDIPWRKMYGLRNRIVHNYEGVDMSQMWAIVKEDIPKVKVDLSNILMQNAVLFRPSKQ